MPQTLKARRIGLARALSKLGYCSRSQAFELIRAGRVQLNGSVRRDPESPVHMDRDRILVDGRPIEPSRKIYVMMNKSRGLVTTTSDEQGRETVYSILEASGEELPWLAPVGRLDKASEGLLLLTNDSDWAARVAAPESHLEKTYHVQIAVHSHAALLAHLVQGIRNKGELLRATHARLLRSGEKNCWLEIILDEGKNRHIRRMFESLGIEVLRLMRVAIGPLELGDLPKGSYRHLTENEKTSIELATQKKRNQIKDAQEAIVRFPS